MGNNLLQPFSDASPFDRIRQIDTEGCEYWSARDLQELIGYNNWREFEDTLERAMIACKNSGREVHLNFGSAPKVTNRGRRGKYTIKDYHLSRYGCYLAAMNGDPRKDAVSQAQTYFAVKTREAEVSQQPQHQQQPIHTLSDAMRARAMKNLASVPSGYFSVMGELFKHLYNLEAIIQQRIDAQAMIEISVGQHWSVYAREDLAIPDALRRKYHHTCPNGQLVLAWAYPLHYVTTFDIWLWETYFPTHFPAYQHYRITYLTLQAARQRPLRHLS